LWFFEEVPDPQRNIGAGIQRMSHLRSYLAGVAFAAVFSDPMMAVAADCNGNGVEDADDIAVATSEDCNADQVPDECEHLVLRFGRGDPFVLGATPQNLVAADVNGDGVDDLVVGNRAADRSSSVSIVLSLGDATWAESVEYPAHERLSSLTAGDFDGDGDLDLATANSTEILVFANAGDGTFAEAVAFAVSTFTRFVTTADVSGDGLLDLVVSNTTEDMVSVLLGDGGGTFGVPRVYPVGERPEQVGVADLDGDEILDLASANADSRSVSVLLGTGGGAFGARTDYTVAGRPRRIHAADLNGDSRSDFIVETSTDLVRLDNRGDGTFREFVRLGLFARYSGVADIDGDRDIDVLAELGDGRSLTVLLNDGAGRLLNSLTLSLNSWLFTTGDFDDDADLDIGVAVPSTQCFAATCSAELAVLWNGEGTFPVSRETFAGSAPHFAILEDFDGDGDVDLATPDGPTDRVSLYRNPGDGRFEEPERYRVADHGHLFALAVGDFNADGDFDLVATDRVDHRLAVMENAGDGTFGDTAAGIRTGREPFHTDVADFDGDGSLDFANSDRADNTLTVHLNDGNATFAWLGSFDVGTDPWGVAHGDFDGDGDNDIVTAHGSSADVGIVWNDGKGDFSRTTRIALLEGPHYVGVADLEGDGDLDIVAQTPMLVVILLNDGTGTFAHPRSIEVQAGGYAVTIGDVNLDGVLDLLTTHWGPNTINILFGKGDATFSQRVEFTVGDLPKVAAIADIDGDGDIDIVCPNRAENSIMILRNQSGVPQFDGDFLSQVCTPLDFEKISVPAGQGVAENATQYLIPARDDETLLPSLFQNSRRFAMQSDFLRAAFPERFADLTPEEYTALVKQRQTRDYHGGRLSRLRTAEGIAYGFDVYTAPDELLSLEETGMLLKALEASFGLGPLVYFPATTAAKEQAAGWEGPGFAIVVADEPPPDEEPEPDAGTPTFELVLPVGGEICGTFGEVGADRDLRQEYELKAVLRLRGGAHSLPTEKDQFAATLFDELVFGPQQETVQALAEGTFQLRRVPEGGGIWRFRFSYKQPFQLSDGRTFEVTIASPIQFRGQGDDALDGSFVFTEEYFTRIVGTEAIRASIDGVPKVRFGSCTYSSLPRVEVNAELDDGTRLRLVERYLEAELAIETAPASIIHTEVEADEERRTVSDYFQLMYSAFRHNVGPGYWVLFGEPLSIAAVEGEVHGVELITEFPPRTVHSAAYLGANLEILGRPGVTSVTRRTLPAETRFRRGDANADGAFNLVDALALLDHIFRRGPALSCAEAGDANADTRLNILDATTLVAQIFHGQAVPAPFPDCGLGADDGDTGLRCASFAGCE
jgi:hypothetical protein